MKFIIDHRWHLFFVLVSLCGLVLVVNYTPDLRLTYDSRDYVESSRSLTTYLHGSNGDHFTYLYRPPILPLYLSFFSEKIFAAKWLNATCYLLSLWLCYFIGLALKFEKLFLVLFIGLIAFSYPWLQNHFFVWSEPLFTTVLLLLVWATISEKSWIWTALLCVILFFIRKAGIFISVGVLLTLLFNREYKKAIWMSLVCGAVFVAWEAIVFYNARESTSQRIFSDLVGASRWHYADVITAWTMPRNVPLSVRITIFCAAMIASIYFLRRKDLRLFSEAGLRDLAMIFLTYLLFFVLFLGASEYSEAERYLSVILPIAVLLVVAILRELYRKHDVKIYWLFFFFLWMTYPVGRTLYHLLS